MFNVCTMLHGRQEMVAAHSGVMASTWSALKILARKGKSGVLTPELLLIR